MHRVICNEQGIIEGEACPKKATCPKGKKCEALDPKDIPSPYNVNRPIYGHANSKWKYGLPPVHIESSDKDTQPGPFGHSKVR